MVSQGHRTTIMPLHLQIVRSPRSLAAKRQAACSGGALRYLRTSNGEPRGQTPQIRIVRPGADVAAAPCLWIPFCLLPGPGPVSRGPGMLGRRSQAAWERWGRKSGPEDRSHPLRRRSRRRAAPPPPPRSRRLPDCPTSSDPTPCARPCPSVSRASLTGAEKGPKQKGLWNACSERPWEACVRLSHPLPHPPPAPLSSPQTTPGHPRTPPGQQATPRP